MSTNSLIAKFVAQLCEKQYAFANSTLATIMEAKLKERIKKEADKVSKKKDSKKDSKSDKKNPFLKMKKGSKKVK